MESVYLQVSFSQKGVTARSVTITDFLNRQKECDEGSRSSKRKSRGFQSGSGFRWLKMAAGSTRSVGHCDAIIT